MRDLDDNELDLADAAIKRGLDSYWNATGDPLPLVLCSWDHPRRVGRVPCIYNPHVKEGKIYVLPYEHGIELSVAHGIRMLEIMLEGT